MSPQWVQATPCGQRRVSRYVRHLSLQSNRSNKAMRSMNHPKKKATLPKDIEARSDSAVAELIFGNRVKKALDRVVETVHKKGVPKFMQP